MKEILPVLDLALLQEKANASAMAGATNAIAEFYNSYDSPYKKAIIENLKGKSVDHSFDIPDIIGVLNQKFSEEIDLIANTAIAKSFIPMIKAVLTREDAEIKFSKILQEFIEATDFKYDTTLHSYAYSVERVEREDSLRSSFFQYQISNGKVGYELRFFKTGDKTTIMSLPYLDSGSKKYTRHFESRQTMKLSLDGGAILELPFTKGILEDPFTAFIARLVIGNNQIIFDVDSFDEDMFERDECHC